MSFFKDVFSEDDGRGSYSRIAAGAIVLSTICWVTYVTLRTHIIPDLTGPLSFMCTGTAVHYGTNKASDIISAFKGKQTP